MTPTKPLSPQEIREIVQEYKDHARFCNHLKIRNKDGGTVPYIQSPGGKKLTAAIRKQEDAKVPVRIVVLKASQVWMSSSCATEIFRRVPFWPGRRALVLADTQAHADLVYGYYDQYVKSYSDNPIGGNHQSAILLPELDKDTEQHVRWSNGSSIMVGTANNVDIGRSAPYNWAQLSEAAFYRSLGALMTGLMQRVPMSADSGVIIESTANGEGGDFYELCQLAMTGKSGWLFVFFAWWEHPENVLPVGMLGYSDRGAFQASLSRSEREEAQRYNLTLEQLAWRRHKIETDCEGKLDRFQQEHPANPTEAFRGSGHKIFDQAGLARMPVIQEPTRGKLQVFEIGPEKRVQFVQDSNGELCVYQVPQKGRQYIVGADHAEGIDPQAKEGRSDPDYCSASVLDIDTGEQVAKLRVRLEPHPWADELYWLARWYNWAYLVPERKAVGKAVIGHIQERQYPQELIYSAERDPSDTRPALLQDLGFDTNTLTRSWLISTLNAAIREGAIKVHDPETMAELRGFVRKPNGREEGIKHDDTVFSLALAVIGIPKARRAFSYRESVARDGQRNWKPVRYGRPQREDDDD